MKAQLENGHIIEYHPQMIGEGTMKQVYFSKDKEFVLCFYKTKTDAFRRLQKIINEFNPTRKDYWNSLFCWPTNIIIKPKLGVMMPLYPTNYIFSTGRWKGKEKKSRWFISPKLRQYLPKEEQASWINYFKICILLARAVNRLHLAGLAHSDLSDNNVLIDPSAGKMIIIDIDSLVVPQIFPPHVDGTPGYIAPEVLAKHPQLPNIRTDQHALAVLIYEYLLKRHPLRGPKIHSTHSAEEDEQLSMGEKALFIEHPQDNSNHPKEGLKVPVTALGSTLTKLFYKAFVTGLHSPDERPTAYQWEKSLTKTWNMLHPCPNPTCSHQWFIVIPEQKQIRCPFCQTPIKTAFPLLTIRSRQWQESVQMVVYEGQSLFKWHVFDNIFPGPDADRRPQAYCAFYQGKWLLINQALNSLISPNGHRVEINQAVELKEGAQISLSQEAHGCIIEVHGVGYFNKLVDFAQP